MGWLFNEILSVFREYETECYHRKKKKNLRDHLTQIAHFTSKKMKAKTEDLAI